MKSLILVLACVFSGNLVAASLPLGDVQMPVEDRSTEQRTKALAGGLDQVLVRLTGSREVAGRFELNAIRQQPSRWATQYRYLQHDEQLLITANFDINGLLSALEKSGAPVWGTSRPEILVWLVLQRPGAGELLARDSVDPALQALQQAASERGLALLLPLMDDQDRRAIAVADIRGHFDHVMQKASTRYAAPLTLAAVLYTGKAPQLRWRLFRGGEALEQGEISTAAESESVQQLVDRLADLLAAMYVIRGGDAAALTLEVRDVSSLQQWNSLQTYLQGLTGVSAVQLVSLSGQELRFNLSFAGDLAQLKQLLALNRNLVACETTLTTESGPALPSYCWHVP